MEHPRCTIFYFSGTGNTAWASRKLAAFLEEGGMPATAVSIEGLSPGEAESLADGSSHIFFGYPIYGSDVPEPMKDFLRSLPPLGLRVFGGFCTQEMFSGDGVRVMGHFLRVSQSGARIAYARHVWMPNNISIEKYGFSVERNPGKLRRIFDRAETVLHKFAADIVAGQEVRQGLNLGSQLLGLIQRVPFRLMYPGLMGCMAIDTDTCSGCDICRRICPMGNIQGVPGNPGYRAGKHCCLCLRCYNYCPENAVRYRGTRAKGKPYQGPEGTLEELLERSK